jgi:NADPH-dependent F420 reductase
MTPASEENAVAIVGGTGALGYGLAARLLRAGTPIVIGSRAAERAHDAADRLNRAIGITSASGATNADAVSSVHTVLLSVPFAAHASTLTDIRDALKPGQLVIDATVPLATAVSGRPTRAIGVWQGSAAQQTRELLPAGVDVVAALHTVSAAHLADLSRPLDEDVLICGDDRESKAVAGRLIESITDLRAVDAGQLEMARILEQLTPLLIGINRRYRTTAGLRIVGIS